MAISKVINVFNDGMMLDIDKLNQPTSSYRYSLNGSLVFNEDGTYSWENELGNIKSFLIEANNGLHSNLKYIPLGYIGGANFIVLFLTEPINNYGEIGIICFDENGLGTYKTLFNDVNDIYGKRFDFNIDNQIEARLVYETDQMIRVYWVDGVKTNSNQPRAFTFKYDESFAKNDVNGYSAVTLSVHSMNLQAEFDMGIIKYKQKINGNLLTGVYQYSYRLISIDGYKTPWVPLTRTFFVTDDTISSNYHDYEMNGVGIDSGKGNRIEVKGIDLRYYYIEVMYVYAQSSEIIYESNIFFNGKISGSVMSFDHLSNIGTPLEVTSIFQRLSNIKAAKTLNVKDNTLYIGNIREGDLNITVENVLANVSIKPIFKDMRDDELTTAFADYTPDYTGTTSRLPLTNQIAKTGTTTVKLHSGVGGDETYIINDDYINYKGTQVEHLYRGYFRGETYRFGIVFFDKIGQPSFAYHLCDMQFPNFSEKRYVWRRLKSDNTVYTYDSTVQGTDLDDTKRAWQTTNFNEYSDTPILDGDDMTARNYSYLRVMGIEVSGIDISSIKNIISGYQIVRAERDEQIKFQGLILPMVRQMDKERNDFEESYPLPTPTQHWLDFTQGDDQIAPSSVFGDIELEGVHLPNGIADNTTAAGTDTRRYLVRPYISAFYPIELYFTGDNDPRQSIDRIKLVGGCWGETDPNLTGDETTEGQENIGYNQIFEFENLDQENTQADTIQKMFYTRNTFHATNNDPYPLYSSQANVEDFFSLNMFGAIDNYNGNNWNIWNMFKFSVAKRLGYLNQIDLGGGLKDINWLGVGRQDTYFVTHSNFGSGSTNGVPYYKNTGTTRPIDLNGAWDAGSGISYNPIYNGMWIANYVRPNSAPYGGVNGVSMEQTIWEGTGHFQPVNNADFAVPDIVNEAEIWGGDCYLNYIDFVRSMPMITNRIGYGTAPSLSAGQGIVFPLESKLNMALRQRPSDNEPSFAHNGMMPAGTFNGDTGYANYYKQGIYSDRDWVADNQTPISEILEEWDYQQVLLFSEVINFFFSPFQNAIINSRYPVRFRYSNVKYYGDVVDSFRQFLANDFRDLDGGLGDVISCQFLFDQLYVLQEQAFGRLRAYDRALVQTANQGNLTTGTGARLDGIDYIDVKFGTQHQWSVTNNGRSIYWVDAKKRKLLRFAGDGISRLSDERGMHQFFNKILLKYDLQDNPTYNGGIVTNYDFNNSLVHITFTSKDKNDPLLSDIHKTLTYNEIIDKFVSFHSYVPTFYMSNYAYTWSIDVFNPTAELNAFYVHEKNDRGLYYDKLYDAQIDVIVNENMYLHKVFDTIRMNINDEGSTIFDKLYMNTESQSNILDITTDNRVAYKEDILRLPLREELQADRMRGKHIKLSFIFKNVNNLLTRFTNLVTNYRISSRM